jgi:hypothetical protein
MLLVARLRSIARQAGIYTHIGLHVFCSDEVMLHRGNERPHGFPSLSAFDDIRVAQASLPRL